jgi:hypothetical protein
VDPPRLSSSAPSRSAPCGRITSSAWTGSTTAVRGYLDGEPMYPLEVHPRRLADDLGASGSSASAALATSASSASKAADAATTNSASAQRNIGQRLANTVPATIGVNLRRATPRAHQGIPQGTASLHPRRMNSRLLWDNHRRPAPDVCGRLGEPTRSLGGRRGLPRSLEARRPGPYTRS